MIVGLWFGGFQALMPLIGYLLGTQFSVFIGRFSHWAAFILLAAIGLNMIREALTHKEEDSDPDTCTTTLSAKSMFLMAVATSIDALAIGVTFAFLDTAIVPAVVTIGVMTFALSIAGVRLGGFLGEKFEMVAEIAGGVILCALGVKILLEHFGVL